RTFAFTPLRRLRSAAPRPLPSFPTRRSSDLRADRPPAIERPSDVVDGDQLPVGHLEHPVTVVEHVSVVGDHDGGDSVLVGFSGQDRKSTRLNSSHVKISYAVFCLKKKRTRGP